MVGNMKLGDSELQLLRFIQDHQPVSVRKVVQDYGEPKGLARTTIQTMMERLRKKGFLQRDPAEGGFEYTSKQGKERTLHDKVDSFVQNTLGGSIAPLASYFANAKNLTQEEIELLREAIDRIDDGDKGGRR